MVPLASLPIALLAVPQADVIAAPNAPGQSDMAQTSFNAFVKLNTRDVHLSYY